MKRKRNITALFYLLIAVCLHAQEDPRNAHLNYLDYAGFQMKISGVNEISQVNTKDGKVKVSQRNNKLIEVQLSGENSEGPGLIIYSPGIYSIVYKYRGFYRISAARAVGVKPEVAPGKIVEVLISAREASMNNAMSGKGEEELYLYFEIPKEVQEFQIQVPKLLPVTGKL